MTNSELKSKVMTLGNKLAPRMRDRRATFVEAWAIVKAGGLELAVKGVSLYGKDLPDGRAGIRLPVADFLSAPSSPPSCLAAHSCAVSLTPARARHSGSNPCI
jgi:hypothetical protein